MKKLKFWLLSLVTVMSATALTACGGDDDEPENPDIPDQPTVTEKDPEGTIISNMLCGSSSSSATSIRFCVPEDANRRGYGTDVYIGNDLNWFTTWSEVRRASVADVGEVKNISAITTVPESGWGTPAVQPGHGYIVRVLCQYREGDEYSYAYEYHRIYVTQYLTSAVGGINGATIKYQPNWKTGPRFTGL